MVRPATKYLCKKGYRMMIGSEVITVAAALIEVGVTVACAFFIVSELAFWLVTELSGAFTLSSRALIWVSCLLKRHAQVN